MAGKTGLGIVCILFCWTFIPAIIGLVEGIAALTKQAGTNGDIYV
jgi:TM2 domain-containing membrane protein YozV